MWSNISSPPKQVVAIEAKQQQQQENNSNNDTSNNMMQDKNSDRNSQVASSNGSPLMRYKHAVCSAPSGYIYIHGGRFGNLPLDDDVWRLDPHQNSWTQLRTSGCKPPNLQEHTLVEHNEHLYLFGGQVSASDTENSFWCLDLLSGEWRSLSVVSSKFGAHLGPTNRRGHSAVVHADCMYIYGGFEDFRGSSNQLWEYNLRASRWELRNLNASSAFQPEPRHSHSAVVYKDSMLVYGGLSNLKPLGDLWRWSWRDKRWFKERTRGQSPGQLHGHTAVQAFGSMFVFGGERNGRPTRGLWRLNLSNMSWQKIRPKGPRPSPTTWHGAIANPLSILDETNYIIEGADSSSELLISCSRGDSCSSMSENCFTSSHHAQSAARTGVKLEHNQQQQTLNHIIRPISKCEKANSSLPKSSSVEVASLGASHVRNSILLHQMDNQNTNKDEQVRGSKRKSRLSFLRRMRQQNEHWPKSTYELKLMQTSASATNFPTNRHSVSTVARSQESEMRQQVKVEDGTNVRILDNLDSDIKEMFQRAELSESGGHDDNKQIGVVTSQREEEPMSVDSTGGQLHLASGAVSASTTCRSSTYYETARQPTDDDGGAMGNESTLGDFNSRQHISQRTSCASYTTPPSELNTLTGEPPRGQKTAHSFLWSADGSELGGSSGFDRRNNRPKSEIVQSLIDRADARIKHLYTPYFNNNNTSSNNNQVGDTTSKQSSRSRHDKNRHSLDRSKRHTLPQTMTYYNLYFSEDKSSSSQEGADSTMQITQMQQQQLHRSGVASLTRDDLSSSTLRAMGSAATSNYTSVGAALVGVHDNGSAGSQMGDNRLEQSQLSLVTTNSSGSRTICAETPYSTAAALTCGGASSIHDNGTSCVSGQASGTTMMDNGCTARPDTAASESCDNTSLSFSVIAEFEEDDMLQYSSPTDPIVHDYTNHRQTVVYNQRPQFSAATERRHEPADDAPALQDHDDTIDERRQTHITAPKSNSSGYDSISAGSDQHQMPSVNGCYPSDARQAIDPQQQERRRHHHFNQQQQQISGSIGRSDSGQEDSSVAPSTSPSQFTTTETSPEQSATKNQLKKLKPATDQSPTGGRHLPPSSTAADSLALASDPFELSSTGGGCNQVIDNRTLAKSLPPSSPPNQHQLQQQQSTQMASTRRKLPLRSKFFGKQKAKTRYWQLCMFVIGGKQNSSHGVNEPITIWRLYI